MRATWPPCPGDTFFRLSTKVKSCFVIVAADPPYAHDIVRCVILLNDLEKGTLSLKNMFYDKDDPLWNVESFMSVRILTG